MNQLRVFLVDDHPVMRSGLKALIDGEHDMKCVGAAFDGESAVQQATELQPDVIVMDISMPGISGIDAISRIRKQKPETHFIALTAHEELSYLQQSMAAGASGFVLKRTAADELLGAIRHASAGRKYVDPNIASVLVNGHNSLSEAERVAKLSEREEAVLKEIARGYSNKQIAAMLNISIRTVETYKARAMEKLGAKSRVDIVKFATNHNWLETSQTL